MIPFPDRSDQGAKLIAVLEANAERRETMKDWLLDRLYMYDNFIDADPDRLLESIGHRLDDVLVLCLDLESKSKLVFDHEKTERAFSALLLAQPPRFPILLHSRQRLELNRMAEPLVNRGWHIATVTPSDGVAWIASDWYPAVKNAISLSASSEPVAADDFLD